MDPVSNPAHDASERVAGGPIPAAQPIVPIPQPVGTPPPPLENEPGSKRLKLIILGVIVVLLAIGIPAGVMVFGKKTPPPVEETTVSTPTPTPDPTSAWKTFTSQKLDFSIKYPNDWFELSDAGVSTDEYIANQNVGAPLEMTSGGVFLTIRMETNEASKFLSMFNVKAGTDQSDDISDSTKEKDLNINGLPAIKIVSQTKQGAPTEGGYFITYAVNNDGKVYTLRFIAFTKDTADKNAVVMENIADTFKFLDANQTGNSFQIPELGIKITVPDSLNDLTYTYDSKVGAAYFSTKRLEAGGSFCTSKDGPIGAIGKILKSDAAKNEGAPESLSILEAGAKASPPTAKDFGTYFINYSSPQATCSDDKTIQAMQTLQISALKQAFSTVELVK